MKKATHFRCKAGHDYITAKPLNDCPACAAEREEFYYPETSCYCAATMAPCNWCLTATEEMINGKNL